MMYLRAAVWLAAALAAASPCGAVESVFGKCPKVEPLPALNMSRFAGTWYVAEVFDNDVECMRWKISEFAGGVWDIEETKSSGLAHIYRGKIYTNKAGSGALKVSWAANLGGKYPLTVYTTDYDTHAGVFLCQQVMFYSRQNGMILSRTPFLDRNIRQKTAGMLAKYDVVMAYFQDVSQAGCSHTHLGDGGDVTLDIGGGRDYEDYVGDYGGLEGDVLDEDGVMDPSEVEDMTKGMSG